VAEEHQAEEIDPFVEVDWAARWLAAISDVWDDLAGAVLQLPPTPGGSRRLLRWPFETPASPALVSAVSQCAADGRPKIQEIVRTRARGTLVALPLGGMGGDAMSGGAAIALYVRHDHDVDPVAERKRIVAQAEGVVSTIMPGLEERAARERLSLALEVMASCLEWEACGAASLAVATELALRMACDRVSILFCDRDTPTIEAVSNSARVDSRSCWAAAISAAVSEAIDQDATVCAPALPDRSSHANLAHQRLCEEASARSVWTIPFSGSGLRSQRAGAICFESSNGAIGTDDLELCEDVVALVGPVLELRRRERDSLSGRWGAFLRPLRERVGRRNLIAMLGLAIVLYALAPGDFLIGARAKLQGRIVRSLAAGVEGYLSEAYVRAGDLVKEGSLMARLDDRDLQIEHRNWSGKLIQLEREYRDALARHDRSRSSVLDAQLAQARAERDLTEAKLARTQLVAPFDGIVMEGDWSQNIGAPVERGSHRVGSR